MPSKTITVTNGDGSTRTITIPDRSRFAGVRTIGRERNELPLTDATTSIKVTVAGHSDLDGIYTGSASTDSTWSQQGGNGQIVTSSYNSEDDSQDWFVVDSSDGDPTQGNSATSWSSTGASDRPWKPNGMGANHAVQITGIAGTETLTVNRTAPVITSDRKGASRPLLSKLVGGAAAAYSLRDLNDRNGNNKVVRVRRASDNHERDFLAKEVSNGTLKNWVNTQTVLPLDIQALTDDGRTGSVIPAKAAYSLRNLSKNYTGNVVDVRRSSDDTTQGFTAAQVTDGTLLAFVNADYAKYTSDFSAGTNSWGDSLDDLTAAGNIDGIGGLDDNLRLTIGSATSQHRAFRSNIFPVSQKINFSARVFIPSTNSVVDSFRITDANGTQIIASTTPAQDQWVTVTASNVTPINSSGQLRIFLQDGGVSNFAGNGLDVIYLREVVVTQVTSDGHVSKWYDQSGEDNHAVQATPANQPKIVKAGVLVDKGIDFDGTHPNGMYLEPSLLVPTIQNSTVVTVSTKRNGNNGYVGQFNRGLDRFYIRPNIVTIGNPATNFSATGTNDVKTIQTITGTSGGLFTYFKDGASVGTSNYTGDVGGGDSHIGSGNNGSSSLDGIIHEIIVYHTDQTDNRTAIEANIGEAYSITGIPAYDNTVDGFVETWYDQSGNSNDATQVIATKQPKIVDGGSMVNDAKGNPAIDWDNVDDTMNLTSGLITTGAYSIFTYHEMLPSTMILKGDINAPSFRYQNNVRYRLSSYAPVVNADFTVTTFPTKLISVIKDSSHNGRVHSDGNESSSGQLSIGAGGGIKANFTTLGSEANVGAGDGKLIELIYYESDQSANRLAIEANINNQYDIY